MNILTKILMLSCLVWMTGCSLSQVYPKQFDTIAAVYPERGSAADYSGAPPDSITTATFEAPFADVFAVAERSTTQNQWIIESVDEASGIIHASRSVKDSFWTPNGPTPVNRRYYYRLDLDEVSPSQSRIHITAKTQGECIQVNRGAMGAMSFGISEASFPASMKNCRDVGSKTTWATGQSSAKPDLDSLVILMRNNLIELGY